MSDAKIYPDARETLHDWLDGVLQDTVTFTSHSNRATVRAMDVIQALKRRGRHMYGYGV